MTETVKRPLCGAKAKTTAKLCQNVAGKGTDHVGEGKCRFHGGETFFEHGGYGRVKRVPLGQRVANIAKSSGLVRLHPELALLRALLEELVMRQQSQKEALEVWYQLVGEPYRKLLFVNDARELSDAIHAIRYAATHRPSVPIDTHIIVVMATLVDKIGRTAERVTKLSGICTSDQLKRIMDCMAISVCRHGDTPLIENVLNDWSRIGISGGQQ